MKSIKNHIYLFPESESGSEMLEELGLSPLRFSAVQWWGENLCVLCPSRYHSATKIKRFEKHLLKCNDKKTNAVQIVSLSLETFQNSVLSQTWDVAEAQFWGKLIWTLSSSIPGKTSRPKLAWVIWFQSSFIEFWMRAEPSHMSCLIISKYRFNRPEVREWWEGWLEDCPR